MEQDTYWYTKYYKGEVANPFNEEVNYWGNRYWNYERDYFLDNSSPNEEDFKDYIIDVISHIADYFYSPFDKSLKDYFGK